MRIETPIWRLIPLLIRVHETHKDQSLNNYNAGYTMFVNKHETNAEHLVE